MQPEDLDRKPENELPLEEKEKSGAPADETKKITVSPSSDGETYKCLKVLTDKGKSRRDKRKAVANLVETYTAEGANKKVSDAALAVIQIAAGVRPIGASEMKAVISDQSGNNVTDLVNDSLGDDEAKGIADNLLEEMKDYEIPRDIRNRLSHGKEIPSDARKEKPYTKCIAIKQGELQGDTASSAKTAKAIMSNLGDLNVPEGIRKKVEVFVALAGVYDPKHTKEITVLAPEETDSSKSDFDPSDRDSVETSNGEGG
jgi:hypothetical protein